MNVQLYATFTESAEIESPMLHPIAYLLFADELDSSDKLIKNVAEVFYGDTFANVASPQGRSRAFETTA